MPGALHPAAPRPPRARSLPPMPTEVPRCEGSPARAQTTMFRVDATFCFRLSYVGEGRLEQHGDARRRGPGGSTSRLLSASTGPRVGRRSQGRRPRKRGSCGPWWRSGASRVCRDGVFRKEASPRAAAGRRAGPRGRARRPLVMRGGVLGSACARGAVVNGWHSSRRLGPPAEASCGNHFQATWLILPVVVCLSRRLSHACQVQAPTL